MAEDTDAKIDDHDHSVNVTRVTLPISLTLSIMGSVITSIVIVIVSYFRLEAAITREIHSVTKESREYTDARVAEDRRRISRLEEPPVWLMEKLDDLTDSVHELRGDVRDMRQKDHDHP